MAVFGISILVPVYAGFALAFYALAKSASRADSALMEAAQSAPPPFSSDRT